MQHIHISDINGKPTVCFDTGLDPRSFARTKMSQSLVEEGYLVYSDGSHDQWKAAGVDEVNGSMRVHGPLSNGKRLDLILKESAASPDAALRAVAAWIRAKMFLGEKRSAQNPGAAFILDNDALEKTDVFFAPEYLSNRCLVIEGEDFDRYNCPDLFGMDAAAFCAGVMLYQILSREHPYPSKDIFQDMRECIFLPIDFAVLDLNKKFADLIQAALLLPSEKQQTKGSGENILSSLLELLIDDSKDIVSVSSLKETIPEEEKEKREKGKKKYLFKQNVIVKTQRFVTRHKIALLSSVGGLIVVIVLLVSTIQNITQRPTTEGMAADTVIMAYYDAFSSLDHMFMEAIVQGAGKADINAAASYYAIVKTRQAYDISDDGLLIPAEVWRRNGGELPADNVFGVTDLAIIYLSGDESSELMMYRAEYQLWAPDLDYAIRRSDTITLKRDRKNNWRIIEILRVEA